MTIIETIAPLSDEEEDRLPLLFPVIEATGPGGATLYIANRVAADDPQMLFDHGITSTMNLAVNIEMLPMVLPDGTAVRRTQIGLIDGGGNSAGHLLSGVLALHGMLRQDSPGKAHYPKHRRGNVLVHCRGGRSRSATVLALYLHLVHPGRFETFETALQHIRKVRGMGDDQPQPAMISLGASVLERLNAGSTLFSD